MLAVPAAGIGSGKAGPKHGGNLVFARTADNLSLDPTVLSDNESIWTVEQMFETLYTVSANGRDLLPYLATSYTRSKNDTVFTFHLRKGVRFSNGKTMTSADVAFSINRARTSKNGITYLDDAIKSVTAPSKYTVVVKTKYPWAPLVADLALFANGVIPANYGGVSEKAFWQHPVGTGPFMFKSWQHGVSLTLVRNPYYWQKGRPYLDSVSFTNVSDDNQRLLQLKGGSAQIIRFPPFSAMASLSHTPGIVATAFPSTRVDYILLNEKVKPYQDVHVRRAISYALDRSAMVKALLFGNGTPANSYLNSTEHYYKPEPIESNLAKAKAEMAKSSVPKGFTTTYLSYPGDKLTELVQAQLKQIGITVKVRSVDLNQVFTIQGKGDYQMTDEYWTEDIPDPSERTGWFLDQTSSHDYFTYYKNARLASLVAQSNHVFDPAKRTKLFASIQAIQAHDLPQIPLYYSPYQYAYSDKVQGFHVTPLGNFHLQDVWLK
jgi:peptide/nickel transport system substrate-binding protein